ncbi:DUF4290 domain-containing protein [Blattabacterium cuenoti]|uniref:DUF4290 domain-containing protein n=1 Tax=Blattabacterium cuenoti TaxID=1653831 RepID=UPI00163C2779|nr:DUF4290 domain-containing protein [Blattabacterium cuenoti]
MEYNTDRLKLVIPEYGRNIHKMIDYAINIKNREKRNLCALKIIKLMKEFMNFKLKKSFPFFQYKLWNQLLIMSKYKLDVDTPFTIRNTKKFRFFEKKIVYPEYLTSFRYYGKIVRNMINVAINCKNEQKKEEWFYAIANTMKKNYLRWNKNIVENDIIFNDLKKLSKGKICLKKHDFSTLLQGPYFLKKKKIK